MKLNDNLNRNMYYDDIICPLLTKPNSEPLRITNK